ncbi:hypothetical protein OG21DRAFT_1316096 [Imleria badia]|nr:hypothetical protein OG21DRAFT_1316096 [Imleria badia]
MLAGSTQPTPSRWSIPRSYCDRLPQPHSAHQEIDPPPPRTRHFHFWTCRFLYPHSCVPMVFKRLTNGPLCSRHLPSAMFFQPLCLNRVAPPTDHSLKYRNILPRRYSGTTPDQRSGMRSTAFCTQYPSVTSNFVRPDVVNETAIPIPIHPNSYTTPAESGRTV